MLFWNIWILWIIRESSHIIFLTLPRPLSSSSEEHPLHDDLRCLCYPDLLVLAGALRQVCDSGSSASAGKPCSPRCHQRAQPHRSSLSLSSSQKEFVNFFLLHYKKEVSASDQMEFINGWYIMIIVSDILTIVGSILKMEIQAKVKWFFSTVLSRW